MTETPSNAKEVLSFCEENDVRFVRLWFTDLLGQLKSFSINAAELDGRLRRRHGVRRVLDHWLQPDRGVGHDRDARPQHLQAGALATRGGEPRCPDVLRHPSPRGRALRGGPALDPAARPQASRGDGLRRLQHRARARVLLLPLRDAGGRRPRGPRRGGLLRPDHARRWLGRAPRDDPRPGAARHPRRVRAPRGRSLPARGRHALQGRARDVRRLHDLPDHGQGVRDEVRLARDFHAKAAAGRERLGHARPSVAAAGTARTRSSTPTTSTSSPTRPRRSSRGSFGTRARSRRCSRSGSTPTSAWSPATRRRSTWPGRGATALR